MPLQQYFSVPTKGDAISYEMQNLHWFKMSGEALCSAIDLYIGRLQAMNDLAINDECRAKVVELLSIVKAQVFLTIDFK